MLSIEEYSLSARELRQTRRNLKKENKKVEMISDVPVVIVPDLKVEEDEDEMISREYCMKENTRRIKRSHEKKEKKKCAKEEVIIEAAAATRRPLMPEKKDNTRRGRRENLAPEKSDKHVSFEEVDMGLKPFRVPSGRFVTGRFSKEKKVANEATVTKTMLLRKRNAIVVDYYESNDEDEEDDDDKDEDYEEEEEDMEFQKRRRVK